MMLDAKRTFDEVDRAPGARRAHARRGARATAIYQELSSAVAGSQEYTAIAKLYELDREHDFDLLVLDTPPSRNALDFLDAPDRLTQFLEGRALQVFLRPTGLAARVVGRGTGVVFGVLKRVTGVDLLAGPLGVLPLAGRHDRRLQGARAAGQRAARRPGRRPSCSSRRPSASRSTRRSSSGASSSAARMPFGGVIVNRVHHDEAADSDDELAAELEAELGAKLAAARGGEPRPTTTCWRAATRPTSSGWPRKLGERRPDARRPPRRGRARRRGPGARQPLPVRLGVRAPGLTAVAR